MIRHAGSCGLYHLACPFRQIRVEPVVNPLATAAIQHHTGITQTGQVPGDLWLANPKGMGEFTDTELAFLAHQKQAAQACLIGEKLEKLAGLKIHAR